MSLYYQIKELYLDIKDNEFILQDDSNGTGAYIKEWKSAYLKPTQVELDSVKSITETKLKWAEVRRKRDALLKECSWLIERHITQKALGVIPALSDSEYTKLLQYMQDLRDITKQANPDAIVYPVYPVKPTWAD